MATRGTPYESKSNIPSLVKLCCSVTLGSNAISSQSCSFGVMTRTGTGAYTMTFNEPWPGSCQGIRVTTKKASGGVFGVAGLDTDSSSTAGTNTISWVMFNAAGAAADLASGVVLLVTFNMKNSQVQNG